MLYSARWVKDERDEGPSSVDANFISGLRKNRVADRATATTATTPHLRLHSVLGFGKQRLMVSIRPIATITTATTDIQALL